MPQKGISLMEWTSGNAGILVLCSSLSISTTTFGCWVAHDNATYSWPRRKELLSTTLHTADYESSLRDGKFLTLLQKTALDLCSLLWQSKWESGPADAWTSVQEMSRCQVHDWLAEESVCLLRALQSRFAVTKRCLSCFSRQILFYSYTKF